MNNKNFNMAILGATGLVGEAMLSILEERRFPIEKISLLASARSASQTLLFKGKALMVSDAATFDFSKVQIALFSAGSEASALYAPIARAAGCIVIDNSSQFRLDKDVPLIIPEVNPEALADYEHRGIIANPNCSTIQMLVALKPIYDAVGIRRIHVATYQSVSGTGKEAISELVGQLSGLMNGQSIETKVYSKQIAFNVLPHIGDFQSNGYTLEEMKMHWETQKILNDPEIQVNATTVRVPVLYGHSEAISIETRQKISAVEARRLLKVAPGVILMDNQKTRSYPTPALQMSEKDGVYVGRIREDLSHPCGLNLWVVADNIRKGAALNAVQIAECLVNHYL